MKTLIPVRRSYCYAVLLSCVTFFAYACAPLQPSALRSTSIGASVTNPSTQELFKFYLNHSLRTFSSSLDSLTNYQANGSNTFSP
jgi:hypothetical protein